MRLSDITAELLGQIDGEFERALKQNKKIKALYQRIRDGTATFENAQEFAIEIGDELSAAFSEYIVPEILPDGKLVFTFGDAVIRPELVKGYDYTSSYFREVQEAFNRAKGLRIKAITPELDADRIKGILNKLDSDDYEKVKWLLEDPSYLQNFCESIVDAGIMQNVQLLAEAGMRPRITRTADAGACDWCRALEGTYDYPTGSDVYRRHRDCHCKVTYTVGDYHQNVWTKKSWSDNEQKAREAFAAANEPTRLSPQGAKALEAELLKIINK